MSRSPILVVSNSAVLGAIVATLMAFPALAQSENDPSESNSRGVRIIDAPTPSPGAGGPSQIRKSPGAETLAPPVLTPAAPPQAAAVPTLTPPAAAAAPILTPPQPYVGDARPAPVLSPPKPELPPVAKAPLQPSTSGPDSILGTGVPVPAATLVPPALPSLALPSLQVPTLAPPAPVPALQPRPDSNDMSPPTPPASNNFATLPKPSTREDVEALSSGLKMRNPAGVSMQILPGPDLAAGSQVSFQISSKKAGYLILLDVDATGRLVQIFPNPLALLAPGGVRENVNRLRPGKPLRIPDRENLYSGFEFVASPPSGTAMVIAILSDRPVQRVDLPDVPAPLAGNATAVDYLTKLANELRIPNPNGNGRLEEPHWSFDAKFYAIR
jgi:hypothetical protein